METGEQKLTLVEKMYNIMSELDYIQKDKKNTFHGYSYASEAAIKNAVHAALVKYRVMFFPIQSEVLSMEKGFGAKQDENLTKVRLSYVFINVDNPVEKLEGSFPGTGADKGDKGVYKAITGALKYALTSTFLIETGDDPEKEDRLPEPEQKPYLNKEERVEASKAAQQVAQRKIQAIREDSPALSEKPARLQAALTRIVDKDSGLASLGDWYMELTEAIGAKPAEKFAADLKKRLGVSASSEMSVEQLRQSIEMTWRKIEESKQPDPLAEIVKDMPLGTGSDAPMWVEKPSVAAKAGVETHNGHIEAEKRRKTQ